MKEKLVDNMDKIFGARSSANRRTFLKGTGYAGLGLSSVALAGTLLGGSSTFLARTAAGDEVDPSATDIAILQFALNLEYLEAEFYTKATTGKTIAEIGIAVSGQGKQGPTEGGTKVNFAEDDGEQNTDQAEDAPLVTIARQIALDEQEHVNILRKALGDEVIAKPEINLNALGLVSHRTPFLAEARAFEDVGVSAYGGAAPLIQSKAILGVAARIALTEGEHTGTLRLLVALNSVRTMAVDGQDILPPPTGKEFFSNQGGLTIVRTPSQVLAILFGSNKPGTTKGGFFPDGVNGSIRSV